MRNLGKEPGVSLRPTQAKQVGAKSKIMNALIKPKFATDFTAMNPQKSVLTKVRCVLLFAILMLTNLPAMTSAQSTSCPDIHVIVLDIRNSAGTVACALFESPAGFPIEFLHDATNIMVIKIRHPQVRCDFLHIPPETYALDVIHDENVNGKLDIKWLWIPTEGYGFSNDAKAFLGAPSFSAARFIYEGHDLDLTISLHY